jgi:hypothetical protein
VYSALMLKGVYYAYLYSSYPFWPQRYSYDSLGCLPVLATYKEATMPTYLEGVIAFSALTLSASHAVVFGFVYHDLGIIGPAIAGTIYAGYRTLWSTYHCLRYLRSTWKQ